MTDDMPDHIMYRKRPSAAAKLGAYLAALWRKRPRPKEPSNQPSIVCPHCKKRSFHPMDVSQRYCGFCHAYHDEIGRGHYRP